MVGMRKDPKVGGGVGGTCEVTRNQTQHSPSINIYGCVYTNDGVGLRKMIKLPRTKPNNNRGRIWVLTERWRPETHTFHLPCGECTITLEDVSLQLGMNVNGLPVTGPTYFDWDEMCGEFLGKVPIVGEDMRGCELKLNWLVENFSELPSDPTEIQLQQYYRAQILYIIGGKLIPDKSNTILTDIADVQLVWQTCIGRCVGLLNQMEKPWWVWGQTNLIFQGVPHGDLTGHKSRLDHMEANDFKCLPYETYINNLEREVRQDKKVWSACTALICFSIIE
ncbi:hypothetical protein Lal_00012434 [Lupinus albus]|nr:hypothetical protein Lal_00012434 [Lupinus albus]